MSQKYGTQQDRDKISYKLFRWYIFNWIISSIIIIIPISTYAQNWEISYIDTSSTSKSDTRIKLDAFGNPRIFYRNNTERVLMHAFRSENVWFSQNTEIDAIFKSFRIDLNGNIHGVGKNTLNSNILYYRFTQSDSLIDTIAVSDGGYSGVDIALSYTNDPELAFSRQGYGDSIFYSIYENDLWITESIGSLPPYAGDVKLQLDGDICYIAASSYGPPGAISFFSKVEDQWNSEVLSQGNIYGLLGFAIDTYNIPYIAYDKDIPGHMKTLNVLTRPDSIWINYSVDTTGITLGSAIGIASNSQSLINIIYSSFSQSSGVTYLKYAYKFGDVWNIEVIDSSTSISYGGGLDIDHNDGVHVAYIKNDLGISILIHAFRAAPNTEIRNGNQPIQKLFDPIIGVYPNPFNREFKVVFKLYREDTIRLDLYDLQGRFVYKLYEAKIEDHRNEFQITAEFDNISGLASGVYFLRLEGEHHLDIRKISYLK